MPGPKILLIDDDRDFLEDLQLFLHKNYQCDTADSLQKAKKELTRKQYDLLVLDIHFGGRENGVGFLMEMRKNDSLTPVIMVTREGDIDTIVKAMKAGANDYLKKPLNFKEFMLRLQKIQSEVSLLKENISLKEQLRHKRIPFLGDSPQIQKIKENIRNIAKTDRPVLITGETGVGKEIAAREIHRQSGRSDKPFYIINCSAIPADLIESELFGHEAGAFTGAMKKFTGQFEQANGGTLLIDEIGELSNAVQIKLLNVLETQEFNRLGGRETINVDIRFLFATNADLKKKIKSGRFRSDLFYRINVFQLKIPPLRERPQDIGLLADYYLSVYSQLYEKNVESISDEALRFLKTQPWPGNIRQLKNTIERSVVFCDSAQLELHNIPQDSSLLADEQTLTNLDYSSAKKRALREFQISYIKSYLKRSKGSITEAARLMNLPRPSLQRMIKELGILS